MRCRVIGRLWVGWVLGAGGILEWGCWQSRLGASLELLAAQAAQAPTSSEKPVSSGEAGTEEADRLYATAVALQNRGSYDLAAEEWTKFLQDHPNDPRSDRATHYLGICYLKLQKPQEAIAAFKKVLQQYPQSQIARDSLRLLGLAEYTAGRSGKPELLRAAAETLRLYLEQNPNAPQAPEALYYRGECFYALGQKKEAAELYQAFLNRYSDHSLTPEVLYALGTAQQEMDQLEAAAKTYDLFLQRFKNHPLAPEIILRRGETLFAQQQYEAAAQWFAAAAQAKDFPLVDYALFRQAAALVQQKKYTEAAGVYVQLTERFPQSKYLTQSLVWGGRCLYLAGQYPQAQTLLEKAVGKGGQEGLEGAHWLARTLLKQGKPSEALAVVQKALGQAEQTTLAAQLAMDHADILYEIPDRRKEAALLYATVATKFPQDPLASQALYMATLSAVETQQFPAALQYAKSFLERFSQHELTPDVLQLAAESHLQLQQYPEAEKLYREALAKAGDKALLLWKVRYALVLLLCKKYQEAVGLLQPLIGQIQEKALLAEAYYVLGASLLELKQPAQAIQALQNALQTDPQWRQADETLLCLAHAYWMADKRTEAKQTLQKFLQDFPKSRLLDRAHYWLAEYLYAEKDYPAAVAQYQKVLDQWAEGPMASVALYGLGWARLMAAQYPEAEAAFNQFLEKYSGDALAMRARYGRGLARQQQGQFAAALTDLQAVPQANLTATERSDIQYAIGLCQTGLQQYKEAAHTFQKLLEGDPNYPAKDKVLYEWAWALQSAGQQKEAAELFGRLAKEHPNSPLAAEALFRQGEWAYQQGDFLAAAKAYYQSGQQAGQSPLGEKAAYKLGWAFFRMNDFQKAEQSFRYQRQCWRQGELADDAAFMEAECLFKQEKWQDALQVYRLVKKPSHKEFLVLALLHSAQAAAQLKQWDTALQLAKQCANEHPHSPYRSLAIYEQAWALHNMGRLDEALKIYETVVAQAGSQEIAARAQFMIGQIHFEQKNHKEAIRSFYRVIAGYAYPKWQADAMYEAARCFEVLGMKDRAINQYKELLEKHPQSDKVPRAKERLQALGG
ncbi:MAG: tetratricopeptide repeat protein [Thermoguttaceae bacterium]|nr:tetratricopeptide repeat protein [Thermoguttaceae bacterium]MDW8037468.1 tetratricopeptide repeat protein [Thermoguttaceae bacterium]